MPLSMFVCCECHRILHPDKKPDLARPMDVLDVSYPLDFERLEMITMTNLIGSKEKDHFDIIIRILLFLALMHQTTPHLTQAI